MAQTDSDIYAAIEAKVGFIVQRQSLLQKEIQALQQDNDRLRSSLEKLSAECQRLKVDNEYLTVASTLTPGRENVEHTRALLAELVREIDRCIADLKAC